jgi:hypothetical protein
MDKTLDRIVAVKVCTADANPHELNVLTRLSTSRQNSAVDPGKDMIPSILDTFTVKGPNGTHSCYVSTARLDPRVRPIPVSSGSDWQRTPPLDLKKPGCFALFPA